MKIRSFIKKIGVFAIMGGMLCTNVFAGENLERYNEMYRLRNEGLYLECVNLADSMIAEKPNLMGAYTNKALAAYCYGDVRTAYETIEKQLEFNPYNEIALYNKACLASVITDYKTVEETIELLVGLDVGKKEYLKLDSDFVNCHENQYMVSLLFHPTIRVCGTVLDAYTLPIEHNERLLVPIRPVAEAMGATLEWNADDKSFAIIMDDKRLIMQIESKKATLNGEEKEVELAPLIHDERSYVPVRFVAEAFDFDVEWNNEMSLVDIYTKVPNGTDTLENFNAAIGENINISAVYGTYIEPYMLERNECRVMIVADEKMLESFEKLNISDKTEFLKSYAKSACEQNSECKKAEIRIVKENMTYYKMNYDLESNSCDKLLYFKNGLLTNVVEQIPSEDNYVDYYLK